MTALSTGSLNDHSSSLEKTSNLDYIVFARKYRPSTLRDVMGQDVLVQALQKAIAGNQLSHAILLHGIRGVGKTTTARIIAKGLNCEAGPTVDPCGICTSCVAIQQDRHLDVIEMDAASHTGVDDMREIIETAKYKAVQGRFKVYIIDEVHMLSKSAFNALLKTLEEPPPFVKFIFATTELQKVPETILSRCMRFDLKRMDIKTIIDRMTHITACEYITLEPDAATLIARAAEGSMRDALSLLDQAFVLSKDGAIQTNSVRDMLGLSSKDHVFDVLKAILSGDVVQILTLTDAMYNNGGDPMLFLKDALDTLYTMICVKTNPTALNQGIFTESEKTSLCEITQNITAASLMQVWQILNDRYDKIYKAPFPGQALQVGLMQVCYVAHLPPLSDILSGSALAYPAIPQSISSKMATSAPSQGESVTASSLSAPSAISAPPNAPASFDKLTHLARDKREPILYTNMRNDIAVETYTPGHVSFYSKPSAPKNVATQIKIFLEKYTDMPWVIEDKGASPTAQSLQEIDDQLYQKKAKEALEHPLVKDIIGAFPGAKVTAT